MYVTSPDNATAVIASEAVVRLVADAVVADGLAPSMASDAEDFLSSFEPSGPRWQVRGAATDASRLSS